VSLSVTFTDARRRLSELVDRVSRRRDHVVITRNGEAEAVLISPDEYESLLETVEILNDSEALDALAESERDVAAGRLVSLDEVRRRFSR
jgi:antitoxin YefM